MDNREVYSTVPFNHSKNLFTVGMVMHCVGAPMPKYGITSVIFTCWKERRKYLVRYFHFPNIVQSLQITSRLLPSERKRSMQGKKIYKYQLNWFWTAQHANKANTLVIPMYICQEYLLLIIVILKHNYFSISNQQ